MGISLSNKAGHMAKSVGRIRCKCKIWYFLDVFFNYYDTTFTSKTVYLRESGKTGSLCEVKTPVKRCQCLDKQREELDLPGKDLEYYNLQNNT